MKKKEFETLCYERKVYARKSDTNNDVYYLYDTEQGNGLDYMGHVVFKNKKVYYNDIGCDDVDELFEAITKHNASQTRPVYLDDPLTRKGCLLSRAYTEYMDKLGYSRGVDDIICGIEQTKVVLKNCYGDKLSEVILFQRYSDINSFRGDVCVNISNGSYLKAPFDGYDEMLASINSILEMELLYNQTTLLKAIERMGSTRNDRVAKIDIDSKMNVTVEDARNMMIERLENALERLRKQ